MRHDISGSGTLPKGSVSMNGKTWATGPSHAFVADTFFSEIFEPNRMTPPAPARWRTIGLAARKKTSSLLYCMIRPDKFPAHHVRSIVNEHAHVNRRAPPGRNPGGSRKREQN